MVENDNGFIRLWRICVYLQSSHQDNLGKALLQVFGALASHKLHQLIIYSLNECHVRCDPYNDLQESKNQWNLPHCIRISNTQYMLAMQKGISQTLQLFDA